MKDDNQRPMATYRLQFNKDFRFADAQSLVPYFSRLGITHIYASPILRARETSTHGYDVVDPTTINPNLGDETNLVNLVSTMQNYGLGLVLDIVPNHMAASIENPYWRDVLTYGPSSPFASWFDIDWRMPDPNMWGRVLVPVLGEPRSRILQQDQIRLQWSDGRFLVRYFDHTFPVDPATVPTICTFGLEDLKGRLEHGHPALGQVRDIIRRLKKLPRCATRLRRRVDIDRDETEHWLAEFAHLVVQSPTIQQWVEETAERFGEGEEGRRRLRKLLDAQPYRLVHWRDAARTINYRRFFDINELISIRQEDPQVFQDTHATVLRWVDKGLIDGLRIDHIDGLRDPLGYLERLAEATADGERSRRPVVVFVEKILAPDEKLPLGWPVAGTTGYEFLNQVEAVFLSREGFKAIEANYRHMLRRPVKFEEIAAAGKRRVLRSDLSPQVGRLADTLLRLADSNTLNRSLVTEEALVGQAQNAQARGEVGGASSDMSDSAVALASRRELNNRDLVDAIVEVIVALPVYRTYVDANDCSVSDADRQYVQAAVEGARGSGRAVPEAVDFLREVLLLENRSNLTEHDLYERVNFIQRFQQLTGPAAAKGIEDTALYAYVPLTSLNEVGGEPHLPDADPVSHLHQTNEERATAWPAGMLCVTTHDSKRSADARARLDVLSELPKRWTGLVRRWRRIHHNHGSQVGGRRAPDAVAEYLFYQSVVALWPAPDPRQANQMPSATQLERRRERIEGYMLKATREAKTRTSWTNQNSEYEDALISFIRKVLATDVDGKNPFLTDVAQLVARIARPGFWNSLARTLVQFTAPGTADLYQGDELWNFALVDPDNRRPVDYEMRQRLLDEVITGIEGPDEQRRQFVRCLVEQPEDSRIKLHVIRSATAVRRDQPQLFATGHYVPLAAAGTAQRHVLAFARVPAEPDVSSVSNGSNPQSRSDAVITIVPRQTIALTSDSAAPVGESAWADTSVRLPEQLQNRRWFCALTREPVETAADGTIALARALQSFPAALLVNRE